MQRRILAIAAIPISLTFALAACGSGSSGSSKAAPHTGSSAAGGSSVSTAAKPASGFASWPNYHRTAGKSGHTTGSVKTPLHKAWTRNLDGAVWEEPVIAGGVLIAGTEHDQVYGLNPKTGKIIWHTNLGSPQSSGEPCGDITPIGITGSPAYDKATGSVFMVATTAGGHHTMWALSARTGGKRWHRGIDVAKGRDSNAEQQRAPLLVVDHRVIVTYGAHDGDCGNYVGYAASISTSGKGKIPYYAVPNARQAGMWSPAGPVEAADGNILTPTANGSDRNPDIKWDHSDGVLELNPKTMHYVRGWAPKNWEQGDADDLSLSSTSPVAIDGDYIVGGKRGEVWLLKKSLGGVGGQIQTLGSDGYCRAFGGISVSGHTAILPCLGFHESSTDVDCVLAITVTHHHMHQKWVRTGVYGSSIIEGSHVFVVNRNNSTLNELSLTTGHVQHSINVGALPTFPSEVVDGGYVFVPTKAGITAVR